MNIYLVERADEADYDEFEGFVCIATSEQDAKMMHPDEKKDSPLWQGMDTWKRQTWPVNPDDLKVTFLGTALPGVEAGVLLSSYYNA